MVFLNEKKERVRSGVSTYLHCLYRHTLYRSVHFLLSFFNCKKLKLYKQPVFSPFRKLPEMSTYPWLSHNRAMLPSVFQYSSRSHHFSMPTYRNTYIMLPTRHTTQIVDFVFPFSFFFSFFFYWTGTLTQQNFITWSRRIKRNLFQN